MFNSPLCCYDVILGQYFLQSIKLDVLYSTNSIKWLNENVAMKDEKFYDAISIDRIQDEGINRNNMFFQQHYLFQEHVIDFDKAKEFLDGDTWDSFVEQILERKYEKIDVDFVAEQQLHLSPRQRTQLRHTLNKYVELFDRKLGRYNKEKFHIDLIDGAQLVFQNPYKVLYRHEAVFKKELNAMVADRTLLPVG